MELIRALFSYFLMRFWLCKIHCLPLICICKSSSNTYKSGQIPLKLENSPPRAPTEVESVVGSSDSIVENFEFKREIGDDEDEVEIIRVRKPILRIEGSKEKKHRKKKVQWSDFLGKELVQIREFQTSEVEDIDDEEDNQSCLCTIL